MPIKNPLKSITNPPKVPIFCKFYNHLAASDFEFSGWGLWNYCGLRRGDFMTVPCGCGQSLFPCTKKILYFFACDSRKNNPFLPFPIIDCLL
jgi:hypothetical protein